MGETINKLLEENKKLQEQLKSQQASANSVPAGVPQAQVTPPSAKNLKVSQAQVAPPSTNNVKVATTTTTTKTATTTTTWKDTFKNDPTPTAEVPEPSKVKVGVVINWANSYHKED